MKSTYVWGNGCVKIGGSFTGSLFGSGGGVTIFDDLVTLGSFVVGFGAVSDGIGGDSIDDDATPI